MAEAAFAIIGGISALGAIAGTVGNISVKILDIAQHAGMAKDEIVEFGSDVQEFSSQLLMVQESLENHCSERQSPRTCKWVDNHNVIPQAMRKSKRVKDRLKQITRQFRKFKNTVSWFCKIKWILQKSLVMALRVEMNSVKTSLILVLNTVRLEEAMQVNPESKEVKTLKNLNLALQYALLRLEKQLTEYDTKLLDDRVETYEAIQDLIRLTESIEKRGIIPSTSRTSRRRHGYGEERRPANQLPTAPINPEATQAGPENSSGTTHVPVAADELTRSPDIVNEILEPHEPNEASSSQRPEPRDELDNHVDFEAAQVAQVHNENQTAIAEHDREYQDVRPVNAVIHIPRHNSQSIGGYINDNQRMVTAIVNEGLDVNLISQAFATRHGIDIEFLDEASGEARPLFDFGKGRNDTKIGSASFKWNDGYRSSRSFTVHCSVCLHDLKPIILGRPFIEKRTKYRLRR